MSPTATQPRHCHRVAARWGLEKQLLWAPGCTPWCANSCPNRHRKQDSKACQHSQGISKRQMNSAGTPKPGEQARSTLPAVLVPPVPRRLSKGLSHGLKGSILPCLHCQLAPTIPAQTGEPPKGLDICYPSPEGTDKVVIILAVQSNPRMCVHLFCTDGEAGKSRKGAVMVD